MAALLETYLSCLNKHVYATGFSALRWHVRVAANVFVVFPVPHRFAASSDLVVKRAASSRRSCFVLHAWQFAVVVVQPFHVLVTALGSRRAVASGLAIAH